MVGELQRNPTAPANSRNQHGKNFIILCKYLKLNFIARAGTLSKNTEKSPTETSGSSRRISQLAPSSSYKTARVSICVPLEEGTI